MIFSPIFIADGICYQMTVNVIPVLMNGNYRLKSSKPFFCKFLTKGKDFFLCNLFILVPRNDTMWTHPSFILMPYPLFLQKWLISKIGIKWSPHCTRHTTISMMKEHSIDETTIKKIVGHSGAMTLTERVYTHLDVRVLIDAINKIVGERENGKENLTT